MTQPRLKTAGGPPPLAAAPVRSEQARLLGLAESIGNMGHFLWRIDTGDVSWSDQIYRMLDVDPATFTTTFEASMAFVHDEDRPAVETELKRAVAERTGFEMDMRLVRRDGTQRHVIARGQPEPDHGRAGGLKSMIDVITDVTEAFATIRSTQDRNEMLDLAAQVAHLGHWVWGAADEHLTFCSDELARIHDMSPVVFRGRFPDPRQISSVVSPRFRQAYRAPSTPA
jgi:hypothetical protein